MLKESEISSRPIAQHTAQLAVIRLALLTQFLELIGVGRQLFYRRDARLLIRGF
ncbi:TPA: hypothetical protein QEM76_005642 [Pseudomonas putida]|nr:hypothetical protein [Pseudomonas putida]HDS1802923.1 hypothetical protein [Pseudomonas putida]HDS1808855.1 hypothetical protein [Pseudomonas putida]